MKYAKDYYLGLDIGTDSVGYAVTDESYRLCRFKGEAMWGSGLFDPANTCEDRRGHRTARRRLDRRQMRVRLLQEFFANEIARVDPRFFVRLRESALFAEDRTDKSDNQTLFNDPAFKDVDFHHKYPTVHHLIVELMNNPEPHDPRLVYIACSWLMAHRGHFLQEIDLDNVSSLDDVSGLYKSLMDFMEESDEDDDVTYSPMWFCEDVDRFGEIIASRRNLTAKREAMWRLLFNGVKPKNDPSYRYDRESVISLLCGWEKARASKLFHKEERYADGPDGIFLGAEEEKLEEVISQLDERDGELIRRLKSLYDWAILKEVRKGGDSISAAKVAVYEQHRKDLAWLKDFLRRTDRKLYRKVFVLADEKTPNYSAFVYNASAAKRAKKDAFSEWLKKEMTGVVPAAGDKAAYEDMMSRLETCAFLPKQVDGDNRVIPHQLYQVELRAILKNASAYLPFLNVSDGEGAVAEKIESVFAFRVPYFVGPLVTPGGERGRFAWLKRKAEGVIRPWNFEKLVDLDASEEAFIDKLIGHCTYYRGEDDKVLPEDSLLYREFEVLNEINPLKINGARITPEAKQRIIDGYYRVHRRVSRRGLEAFLVQEGLMRKGDEISGVDETLKSGLNSYHDFKGWLDKGSLTPEDVEKIILRSACTEDASRMSRWLEANFGGRLDWRDLKKICRFKYSEFGRLSRKFLDGLEFTSKDTGEKGSVIDFMRNGNVLLMELLSDRYTLGDEIRRAASEYYEAHKFTMEKRLDEMYVSSAVKRQIYRALDIVKTVVKVMGKPPRKIFVEMARGGTPDQKGKRTKSRCDQLRELYARVNDEEVRQVNAELERMGDGAHNRLQGDALFLWYLQLGRCAYCGKPLPVENLKSVANIDHIHPQSKVKDDSVMNNKVLCCSCCNDRKKDVYPVPSDMHQDALWTKLHANGLMTEEKYRRLMRRDALTDEELQGFINRQLVETRQTTKAIFTVLQELFPRSETVAVKAGNVSDFRHEFGLVKCRAVNDLHHAKDAYLNIVVGNVYHEKFSKRFFSLREGYSMKVTTLFGKGSHIENADGVAWNGISSISCVKSVMARNDIHLTKYAFYKKRGSNGGLFDQNLQRVSVGTVSRKKGMDVAKYGGYAKPTMIGFVALKYKCGKKVDIGLSSIDLIDVLSSSADCYAVSDEMAQKALATLEARPSQLLGLPLGRNILKVNTCILLGGVPYVIAGKTGGSLVVRSLMPLMLDPVCERYVKRIESFVGKIKENRNLTLDEKYDHITSDENIKLYDMLTAVMNEEPFLQMPSSQGKTLKDCRERFVALSVREQVEILLEIIKLGKTNRAGECNLKAIGGSGQAGKLTITPKVSALKKFVDVRVMHSDFSGMFRSTSENLLDLL